MGRHDHLVHAEERRDLDRMQRPCATEGDECEVTVVDAALDGHEANGIRHVLSRCLQNSPRRGFRADAELFGERAHGFMRA